MSLSDMPQEQQKKILIVLVAICVVVGGIYFAGMPLVKARKSQSKELEELSEKIEKAQRLSDRQGDAEQVLEAKSESLSMTSDEMIAPTDNIFVWATENLYQHARKVGVEIGSINEVALKSPPWDTEEAIKEDSTDENSGKKRVRRYFIPYQVKVDIECSYSKLIEFIREIENSNRYASIQSISIRAQDQTPTIHNVGLTVAWLRPKKTAEYSIDEIVAGKSVEQPKEGE